ncbi:MAG: TGS domain-containing protein [Candidatus Aenigmatarchaeota archaeon]
MPINATPEYAVAHRHYLEAKTREEKIAALEEMIKHAPKHKGGENLLLQLKQRLAKLKSQKEAKAGRGSFSLPKEGDAQIALVGFTQSGKSTLLSKLTNAKPEIADRPFTTTVPQVGVAEWKGVKFQLVEIPSTFLPVYMNVAQNSDGIIYVYDSTKDLKEQQKRFRELKERFHLQDIPSINTLGKAEPNTDSIFQKVWEKLGLLRIYTKEPGKEAETRAMVLEAGDTVEEAAAHVHKEFVKYFKYARVWGKSIKHGGERVGLNHILEDGDVLEIHA